MFASVAALASDKFTVSVDFPGGSGIVVSKDAEKQALVIRPTDYPNKGWICWWYIKVEGLKPGEDVTLEVKGMDFAMPEQAVFSVDNKSWRQTARSKPTKGSVTYTQKIDATEAWFAWGPPFTLADADALTDRAAKSAYAKKFELCKSTENRSVPALRVTECADPKPLGIWIEARQHAWECGSSWVAKGFLDWIVSDDPRAAALRKKASITIVPVMDADCVERGAGGKQQKPHDHNRDWSDAPHWPEVRAAQAAISEQNAAGMFDVFIDLHNPAPNDRQPFFFLPDHLELKDPGARNQKAFLAFAKEEMRGPLAFRGMTKESDAKYDKEWKVISSNWIAAHCAPHVLAITLETSWNTPESTIENYERIGRELGLTVERYVRDEVRKP